MVRYFLFFVFLLTTQLLHGQTISGNSSVTSGQTHSYTFNNGTVYGYYTWYINPAKGVVLSTSVSGTTYTASVKWTDGGSATLSFSGYGQNLANKSITISCPTVSTPNASFSYSSNTCGEKIISYSTTPTSGLTWFWQTTSTGTATTNSTNTFTTSTSGTFYLRARCNTTWSSAQATAAVTVNFATAPATPTVSSNICGARTISKNGSPPGGHSWYWQGTNQTGEDYTSPTATAATYTATTSGAYYIRARNSSGCWSTAVSVDVSVDNASAPNPASLTFCEAQTISLTTTGINNTLRWYNSSNVLVHTGITYTPATLNFGTHTYTVKNFSANSCESPGATVTVTINEVCDNLLNWTETKAYGINPDGSPKEISASRSYSNGLGETMQSQTRSYVAGQIFASQSIYDASGNQTLSTLAAPLNRNTFGYRHRFVTNASGNVYNANDFDAVSTVNNPNPVASNGPGTLGWYYSSANTWEPQTATTNFPYARSWSQDGPNPLQTKSAGAGDNYKMGSGHEVVSEKFKFNKSELTHYYNLQPHFWKPNPFTSGTNLITGNVDDFSLSDFGAITTNLSIVTQNARTYVKVVPVTTTGNPGVVLVNGTITVTPGTTYKYSVQGYREAGDPRLYVKNVTANNNLVWPGAAFPLNASAEDWIETSFTVPAGCTTIQLGVLFNAPQTTHNVYINAVSLQQVAAATDPVMGYKIISTDPDGKKSATFTDADGNTLASALVTGTTGTFPNQTFTYDYWSYTYYNDLGQVLASVAPQGVNIPNTNMPEFVTRYKYDQLGRLIETTSTDEGTTQYVYSTDGKIRFSQNQEQRNAATKRFSYTNYDYLGRLIEAGEYTQSGSGFYVFETHETLTPGPTSILTIIDNTGYTGITKKNDPNNRCSDYSYIEYDAQATDFTAQGSRTKQNYLIGQVAKTENAAAKTWYSYDEFGQLEWTIQNITGLGNKIIDYTYDYLGNVLQVAYQAGQTDAFYHHYTYDNDQRLISVETSLNGTTKTLQAYYRYYLHGPLKRVELGGNKQGIDYVYTITGALKSINHMDNDAAKDPGLDGVVGSPNAAFAKDAWGQTLLYHDNDYTGAGYNAGSVSLNSGTFPNQFGGNIRAAAFNSPTEYTALTSNKQKRIYGYQYDSRNQLINAQFGSVSGNGSYTTSFNEEQREQITGYDKNGNINGLVRKGKTAQTLGNYTYDYETNSNRLDKVNHNSAVLVDYTYNSIGQMITQTEGSKVMQVSYTPYGLVKEVKDGAGQSMVVYTYDDKGNRIKKVTTIGGNSTSQYYVYDATGNVMAVYEQVATGPITKLETPIYGAGRIGMYKQATAQTLYEVSDHLGNVRAVIGELPPTTYMATMESENVSIEQPPYKNITERRVISTPANHTAGGNEAIRLNNTAPAGPSIILPVSPGDKIDLDVWAYYEAGSNYNNIIDQATMINFIASAFGGVSGAPGDPGTIWNNVQSGFPGTLGTTGSGTLPAAFLTYVLYDQNFNKITAGWQGVTANGNTALEHLIQPQITIEQPGYIYVIVYNRSNSASWVYFDDLKVVQTHSTVVAASDYYPFGLVMDGRQVTDVSYRYGYQGQYAEKDNATGWNEFDLRMYDARFGRWISPDPYGQFVSPYLGLGNNPVNGVDPDGGAFFDIFANADGVEKWFETAAEAAASGFTTLVAKDLPELVVMGTKLTDAAGKARVIYASTKVGGLTYKNDESVRGKSAEFLFDDKYSDCVETVMNIFKHTDPELYEKLTWDAGNGKRGANVGVVKKNIEDMGGKFRQTDPLPGDVIMYYSIEPTLKDGKKIMVEKGHIEMVMNVEKIHGKVFYESYGAGSGTVPRIMGIKDGNRWLFVGRDVSDLGRGKYLGFWTPPF
ncbi:MAG: RHS repeat-associated core domain-containing protein [Cyclobacteriaceae bacterium]|nr:RHS repeat-associated core domain-containing protein [Cyclobacteriaceae bacterium]